MDLLGRSERIKNSNGMDMYQAVLFKDMVTNKSCLKDITEDEDKNQQMLLLSLAKFLVTKHYKLKILDDWRKWKQEKPTENFFRSRENPFGSDQKLSKYFEQFCEKLFRMMEAVENPTESISSRSSGVTPRGLDSEKSGELTPEKAGKLTPKNAGELPPVKSAVAKLSPRGPGGATWDPTQSQEQTPTNAGDPASASSAELKSSELKMILTQSQTFINFFDISLNKAAYEVVFLLGSTYKSVLLLNCLNLFHYTEDKLRKHVEISDDSIDSEEKDHLYGLHQAFEYFVHHVEGTFALHRDSGDAILVGTHAEQFQSMSELNARKDNISRLITEYAQSINIDGALAFNGEIILKQELKKHYFELIDRDERFEEYIPMKFLFFRCFLHSMDKLFITYEELKDYATKCGLDPAEIRDFLALFRKLCSLFHLKTRGEEQSFVVLQPTKFVKGLDSLYSSRKSLPKVDRLLLNNGLLSEKKARDIWSGPGNESVSRYNFYTSILTTFGMMTQVPDHFFLPSLRLDYSRDRPSTESNSMIILYNMALIPFHKICLFVDVFTKERSDQIDIVVKFLPCADYNVVKFECVKADKVIAIASVRFRCQYLELFVTGVSKSYPAVYSVLKTACVKVLNKMCTEFEGLKFTLAIVCPKSEDPLHFAKFDPTVPSGHLTCDDPACAHQFDMSSHPAGQWVLSAYTNDPKTAIHPKGMHNVLA